MHSRIVGAIAAAAALIGPLATPVLAADADWAGFYMGIDSLDGSVDYLSIVPVGEGKFRIRVKPSIFVLCDSRDGWIVADGRLEDGRLVRENVNVNCEGADPKTIPASDYTRDEATGILTLKSYHDQRELYYHRMSGK